MSKVSQLPAPVQGVVDNAGRPERTFYDWCSTLTAFVRGLPGSLADASIALTQIAKVNGPTFLGNSGTTAASPAAITPAVATSMLNAVVGDTGSGGTKGVVPAPPAGSAAANKFLAADGTFKTVTGTGTGSIAVGSTAVSGGTSGRPLYDNAGTLGEYTNAALKSWLAISNADVSGLGTSATHAVGDFAQTANNLSDLLSATSARTNLGLGSAAVLNVGTLTGTVAAGDDSRITGSAQKANNLSDLASAATARTNLALGTVATHALTEFCQTANNLGDVVSVVSARTNLGLAAIAASGSATDLSAGTVPAARMPALTGDVTSVAGAVATTLASTAVAAGSYGGAGQRVSITVDAKGRLTAASQTGLAASDIGSGTLAEARGGTGVSATPAFRANRGGTNQTGIASATWTKVQLNAKTFDRTTAYDATTNFRFTPQTAGKYQVNAQVSLLNISAGVTVMVGVRKNGSEYTRGRTVNGSLNTVGVELSDIVDLNGSTDYIEMWAYHEDSAARDIRGDLTMETYCSAVLVCPT